MTSQQLDEERIFHLARRQPDADAQAEYLDQVCAGDQPLRDRVEELLRVEGWVESIAGRLNLESTMRPRGRPRVRFSAPDENKGAPLFCSCSPHLIVISPKNFFGKLMSPLIRVGIGKQTRQAASNLRSLLESSSD